MAGTQREGNTPATQSGTARPVSRPGRFIRPSVLISTMGRRKLDTAEKAALLEQIAERIAYIRRDLSDNAASLRTEVENFIVTMGTNQDEIGECGIVFLNPSGGPDIVIPAIETADTRSKEKIRMIVEGCVALAKADLGFLLKAEEAVKSDAALSEAQLRALKDILEKNTYWRAITLM